MDWEGILRTAWMDGVLRRGLLFVEWIVIIYNWQNLGEQRSWNLMIYQTSILVSSKHLTLSRRNIYDRPWLIKRPLVLCHHVKAKLVFFTKTLQKTSTKKRENSFLTPLNTFWYQFNCFKIYSRILVNFIYFYSCKVS